jgi:hypothetical protein
LLKKTVVFKILQDDILNQLSEILNLPISKWFLLSSYEIWESIGFTSEKSFFFLQILTFYIILYLKNMIRAKTIFSVCHVPPPFGEICATPTASPLKARKLKISGKLQFGPT